MQAEHLRLTRFDGFCDGKRGQYGARFDASDLDPRFIPFFNSGERIRVETLGVVLTGTVGVTAGWRPAFILMRRSIDRGSSWVLGPRDRILARKVGRAYVALD